MLHEAALFVTADEMLVEVLQRVREQDADITLPPMHVRAPGPRTIASAIVQHLQDEADVRSALTGATSHSCAESDIETAARRTCAVVSRAVDGQVVGSDAPPVPVQAFLLRATVERSLLAHYVAAYLGSTACPLPEELARPLWELTSPDAAVSGLPDHVPARPRCGSRPQVARL